MTSDIERRLRAVLLSALVASLSVGCDRDDVSAIGEGERVAFELNGLRGIIERHATAGDGHLLVGGRAGRDLHGHVLWADTAGRVLLDEERHHIQRPQRVLGCIEGDAADVYWLTFASDDGEGSMLFIESIRDSALVDGGAEGAPEVTSTARMSIGRVVGLDEGCGVCMFDPAGERLSCQLGLLTGAQRSWHTGLLGEWTVLSLGERLVLADWGADDEGLIVIRITPLDDGTDPAAQGWLHSYQIGQLPSIADPAERRLAHPTFLPDEDHVNVIFVDGTDWFTRLFIQSFPLDAPLPEPPTLIESCRGTCKVHWADLYDGAGWIWYEDQNGDWAVRLSDVEELARVGFNPPPNVESLGGGLFKMGLGNEVANWWALVGFELD